MQILSQQPSPTALKILKEYVQKQTGMSDLFYSGRDWIINPAYGDNNHLSSFVVNLRGTPAKFTFFIYIWDQPLHILWFTYSKTGILPKHATKVRSALKALAIANGFHYDDAYAQNRY